MRTLTAWVRRERVPLLGVYLVFAAAVVHAMVMMPSATYRDEWGFAEFATARGLQEGDYPPPLPAGAEGDYLKVRDIQCALCTQVAAVAVSHLTGAPLSTVYAHGWWGALLAPLLAYALLRQVASPVWSSVGALAATTLTVGFPYYLVDPKGLLLTTHALFLLAAWRVSVSPTVTRTALAAGAALLTATVYMPFGIVQAGMLMLLLLFGRAPRPALLTGGGILTAAAVAFPSCYMPFALRILNDLRLPEYPPRYVPYLFAHPFSAQLTVALVVLAIVAVTFLGRPGALRSQRFLLAAALASLGFLGVSFSTHRLFTFLAIPLAFVLAESATHARDHLMRATAPKRQSQPAGMAALASMLAAVMPASQGMASGFARAVGALVGLPSRLPRLAWRNMLLTFLVASLASSTMHPASDVARSGTFTPEYVEGVRWVAENVHEPYTSDLKFAGAVYALTGNGNGRHLFPNYDDRGELTRMWYSPTVEETIAAMQESHGSRYLVLTSDMTRTFVVNDYFRVPIDEKLAQVRGSDDFRLLFRNADVEVYVLDAPEAATDGP